MRKLINIFLFSFAIFVLISSCDDPNDSRGLNFLFPENEEVSYIDHVDPFLRLRCASALCHSSIDPAVGLDLTNWAAMQNFPALLSTSINEDGSLNADPSLLMQVVDGRNPHLENYRLILPNNNQQQGIRRWIEDWSPLN